MSIVLVKVMVTMTVILLILLLMVLAIILMVEVMVNVVIKEKDECSDDVVMQWGGSLWLFHSMSSDVHSCPASHN